MGVACEKVLVVQTGIGNSDLMVGEFSTASSNSFGGVMDFEKHSILLLPGKWIFSQAKTRPGI